MPIFMNGPAQRDLFSRIDFSSRDRRTYSPNWASSFTERLSSRMSQWGEASKTKTMELTSQFNPFQLKDLSQGRREATLKEAAGESEAALGALSQAKQSVGPITSLSKLVQTRQNRLQSLQKARKSLERAKGLYEVTGTKFDFDLTGYKTKVPEASAFEQQFDEAIAQRQQQYAEMYGYESFADVPEGYSLVNLGAGNIQEPTAGRRDIMDMIMSDITGESYRNLVNLNTYAAGSEFTPEQWSSYRPSSYTEDQMEALKAFYVASNLQSYQTALNTSRAENRFRRQAAKDAERASIASGKTLKKSAEESLGQSMEDVQLQVRELDETFMKNLGAFTTGPRKKKVRSVTFDEGRPQ